MTALNCHAAAAGFPRPCSTLRASVPAKAFSKRSLSCRPRRRSVLCPGPIGSRAVPRSWSSGMAGCACPGRIRMAAWSPVGSSPPAWTSTLSDQRTCSRRPCSPNLLRVRAHVSSPCGQQRSPALERRRARRGPSRCPTPRRMRGAPGSGARRDAPASSVQRMISARVRTHRVFFHGGARSRGVEVYAARGLPVPMTINKADLLALPPAAVPTAAAGSLCGAHPQSSRVALFISKLETAAGHHDLDPSRHFQPTRGLCSARRRAARARVAWQAKHSTDHQNPAGC